MYCDRYALRTFSPYSFSLRRISYRLVPATPKPAKDARNDLSLDFCFEDCHSLSFVVFDGSFASISSLCPCGTLQPETVHNRTSHLWLDICEHHELWSGISTSDRQFLMPLCPLASVRPCNFSHLDYNAKQPHNAERCPITHLHIDSANRNPKSRWFSFVFALLSCEVVNLHARKTWPLRPTSLPSVHLR